MEKIEKRREHYELLLSQAQALISADNDLISNMANLAALLKEELKHLWIGFYLVKGETLHLGPFQGSIACTRISKGKGVCGTAWERNEVVIVPNVHDFPGHIACNSASQSEIVIPISDKQGVFAVLDIDSEQLNTFDNIDAEYLQQMVALLKREPESIDYFREAPFAVTVCNQDAIILNMNEKSVKTFVKDGKSIIGNSLFDCHPERAAQMLRGMLASHNTNAYTIEKNGIKKLIYQTPWFKNGEFAGYIELSMEIPFEMKHFVRK